MFDWSARAAAQDGAAAVGVSPMRAARRARRARSVPDPRGRARAGRPGRARRRAARARAVCSLLAQRARERGGRGRGIPAGEQQRVLLVAHALANAADVEPPAGLAPARPRSSRGRTAHPTSTERSAHVRGRASPRPARVSRGPCQLTARPTPSRCGEAAHLRSVLAVLGADDRERSRAFRTRSEAARALRSRPRSPSLA